MPHGGEPDEVVQVQPAAVGVLPDPGRPAALRAAVVRSRPAGTRGLSMMPPWRTTLPRASISQTQFCDWLITIRRPLAGPGRHRPDVTALGRRGHQPRVRRGVKEPFCAEPVGRLEPDGGGLGHRADLAVDRPGGTAELVQPGLGRLPWVMVSASAGSVVPTSDERDPTPPRVRVWKEFACGSPPQSWAPRPAALLSPSPLRTSDRARRLSRALRPIPVTFTTSHKTLYPLDFGG